MQSLGPHLAQVGDHHLRMTALDVPDLLAAWAKVKFKDDNRRSLRGPPPVSMSRRRVLDLMIDGIGSSHGQYRPALRERELPEPPW